MARLTMKIFHHQNHIAIPYLDNLNLTIQYPIAYDSNLIRTTPYYPFIYSYILILLVLIN